MSEQERKLKGGYQGRPIQKGREGRPTKLTVKPPAKPPLPKGGSGTAPPTQDRKK